MILDRPIQLAYVVAYRLALFSKRFVRWPHIGVGVAVWHEGKLLIVQQSYRRGYSLPGGRVKRNEDPIVAACRELREEVGIIVEPDKLEPVRKDLWTRSHQLFEYRPTDKPDIKIDNREIIEATFVDPKKTLELGIQRDSGLAKIIGAARISGN